MLGVRSVLGESLRIYRMLWRRSLVVAALVYAVVDGTSALENRLAPGGTQIAVGAAQFVIATAGPVLLQGALVLVVADLHEAHAARGMSAHVAAALRRIGSLAWASFVYAVAVFFGLLLLVVPGAWVASRWCLLAPAIVVEGHSARSARRRSSDLVGVRVWPVFWVVVTLFVITAVPPSAASFLVASRSDFEVGSYVWNVLTAPLYAHALTVLYFRLADPARPVIAGAVRGWRSVWAGA